MNQNDFNALAQQVFGERVRVAPLIRALVNMELVKYAPESPAVTQDEIDEYGELAFCADGKCPVCRAQLDVTFQWGIRHGEGFCSACHGSTIQFYHRVRRNIYPYLAYVLVGWNDGIVEAHGLDPHREVPAG